MRLSVQSLKQAEAALRLQRANAVPDPEVLFGYKRTSGFNTVIAGLQLNLPVRNRNQGAIGAAAADETAAAAELRATRTAARTEIVAFKGQYEQKRQLVEQTLPIMRAQAAETSRIAEAVYREGASDLLRLLDAERIRIQSGEPLHSQSYRLSPSGDRPPHGSRNSAMKSCIALTLAGFLFVGCSPKPSRLWRARQKPDKTRK